MAGGRVKLSQLEVLDRVWVVAEMRRGGLTAGDIADRLSCSERTIREIVAEPATCLARLLQDEAQNFERELSLTRSELRMASTELEDLRAALARYRVQIERLVNRDVAPTTFPCGCPRTAYNSYIAPKTGKAGCREHRRQASARHRQRRKQMS